MLQSITISGYRGFQAFSIGELGRLNLISGANGVGKTAVLEWLHEQHPGAILCADTQRPPPAQLVTRYQFLLAAPRHELATAFRLVAPDYINAAGILKPHLGGGIYRVLEMLLAVIEGDSLALIDEMENGLHHTLLPNLWRAIDQLAAAHRVQVIATTHSADCVRAAAGVFGTQPHFRFHRLDRRADGTVEAITYSPFGFQMAVQNDFEIR